MDVFLRVQHSCKRYIRDFWYSKHSSSAHVASLIQKYGAIARSKNALEVNESSPFYLKCNLRGRPRHCTPKHTDSADGCHDGRIDSAVHAYSQLAMICAYNNKNEERFCTFSMLFSSHVPNFNIVLGIDGIVLCHGNDGNLQILGSGQFTKLVPGIIVGIMTMFIGQNRHG
jgi:hypothetical protein